MFLMDGWAPVGTVVLVVVAVDVGATVRVVVVIAGFRTGIDDGSLLVIFSV